jgi:7-cyano-7-deazaguanine synthase
MTSAHPGSKTCPADTIVLMSGAVCLVSGGLDSCVAAAVAVSSEPEVAFLHIRYGQRTESRELRAFHDIADFFGVQRRLAADIGYLSEIGGSALTDPSMRLPSGELDRKGIPVSYVPFRNANLLAIAASWAEVLKFERIVIGAVEEDSSGYPDCRQEFFSAFNRAIHEGTRPETRIEIITPLIRLSKREIVRRGIELKAPLHLTWSCYREQQAACGECDSCLLRLRGFQEAGVEDPIPYAQPAAGRGDGAN